MDRFEKAKKSEKLGEYRDAYNEMVCAGTGLRKASDSFRKALLNAPEPELAKHVASEMNGLQCTYAIVLAEIENLIVKPTGKPLGLPQWFFQKNVCYSSGFQPSV